MQNAHLTRAGGAGAFCDLCQTRCLLREGETGPCGLRTNRRGRVRTRVADRVLRVSQSSIESAGFFHVVPGSRVLSVTAGNGPSLLSGWLEGRSRRPHRPARASPWRVQDLARLARELQCDSLLFRDVEPLYFVEAVEKAFSLHPRQFYRLIQTQAGMTPQALDLLGPLLDGASVVVPTMQETTASYFGTVPPHVVRDNLRRLRKRGVWVEVTTPIHAVIHASAAELKEIALSLRQVDPGIPWHLRIPGSARGAGLVEARRAVRRAFGFAHDVGLENVYTNGDESEELTFCPRCFGLLVARYHGMPSNFMPEDHRCPTCSTHAQGLFTRIQPPEEEVARVS